MIRRYFETLKSILAVSLSVLMVVESAPAAPIAPAAQNPFAIALNPRIGSVTEAHAVSPSATTPDVIVIEDLHVNRSVQTNISRILESLDAAKLVPSRIAVEAETGAVDLTADQSFSNAKLRRQAADYLLSQGELPGAFHFLISKGIGSAYGVENAETYRANLEVFRQTYGERTALLKELAKLENNLPILKRRTELRAKATTLQKDIEAVSPLVAFQAANDEVERDLGRAIDASTRLKQVLPAEQGKTLANALAAGSEFYTMAYLRDEDLLSNTLALRAMDHQTTTVLVVGGFHTPGIVSQLRAKGLSYAVVTPVVGSHTRADEALYAERLMGHHLTSEQIVEGRDWAAMTTLGVSTQLGKIADAAKRNTSKLILIGATTASLLGLPAKKAEAQPVARADKTSITVSKPIAKVALAVAGAAAIAAPGTLLAQTAAASNSSHPGTTIVALIAGAAAIGVGYFAAQRLKKKDLQAEDKAVASLQETASPAARTEAEGSIFNGLPVVGKILSAAQQKRAADQKLALRARAAQAFSA